MAALLLAAALAGGCGGDDDDDDGQDAADAPADEPSECVVAEGHAERSLLSAGMERTYLQDVPPGVGPSAPLVIGLHGYGASGAMFHLGTDIVDTAHEHGFVLLAPDARPDDEGHLSWEVDPGSADVRFIEDLIDHAVEELCVDPERVHLTGHSQGGFLISTLACTSADRITSVAVVAGLRPAPPGCAPADPVPALAFHDTGDPIVPFTGGLPVDLAARLGLPADGPSIPDLVAAWSSAHGGATVQLETTDRFGHGWPPQANEVIWSFFSREA